MNNYYQLYVEDCLNLAETIVVKLDDVAAALNYSVMRDHGLEAVNLYDKGSWKYYQNISGRYHFSDTMMQISSLDTAETIDFTAANLTIHLATRQAYQFGSRYYKELVLQYPEQEILILGILYPTDMQKAIDAVDGTIVSYPSALVEGNEYNFISKLQGWVYKYLERWVNKQFTISDDLYVASYVGQLYMHMVQAIFSYRLEACKTNEAHSFHVKQYLASHGALDVYLSELTKSQALWLYRNILYIQRHAGKKDTFNWLMENILTVRNLPLYEYSMVHNVAEMTRTDPSQQFNYLPKIEFKRKPLNNPADNVDQDVYTLAHVLGKIEPLAPGNYQYHLDHAQDIENDFAYSLSAVSATKILESAVTDYSDAVVYTLADILFNHWLSFVAKNLYVATVVVDLPASGEVIRLEAPDAVALFLYAIHKSAEGAVGTDDYAPIVRVPTFYAERVVRTPIPPMSELTDMVESKFLSTAEVQEIYDTAIELENISSIEAFFATCKEIYLTSQKQYTIYANKENKYGRGYAQAAVAKLYADETLRLPTLSGPGPGYLGLTYVDFLAGQGLDFTDYTKENFYTLALSIVSVATGMDKLPSSTLAGMQKAMIGLFTKLSSYSIQVITDVNASNIVVINNPAIRPGDWEIMHNQTDLVPGADVRVLGYESSEIENYPYDLSEIFPMPPPEFGETFNTHVDNTVNITPYAFDPENPPPGILINSRPIFTGLEILSSFSFYESVQAMTEEMRINLVDTYCSGDSFSEMLVRRFAMFHYIGRQFLMDNGITYISGKKTLDAFNFVGGNKELEGLKFTGEIKVLEGLRFVSNTKVLDSFSYSGGHAHQDVGFVRVLNGFTYNSAEKDLDGFTYSGGHGLQGIDVTGQEDLGAFVLDLD